MIKKQNTLNFLTLLVAFIALVGMLLSFSFGSKEMAPKDDGKEVQKLEVALKESDQKVITLQEQLTNIQAKLEENDSTLSKQNETLDIHSEEITTLKNFTQ